MTAELDTFKCPSNNYIVTRLEHCEFEIHWGKPISAQSRLFGVKFSLREIGSIFSTKIRKLKLWKMSKLLIFRFPEM